jgi:hypothetical protein
MPCTQFTCLTGTKVQILTLLERACSAGDFLDPMGGFLNSNSQSSAAGCDSSSDAWNVGAGMTYADVC